MKKLSKSSALSFVSCSICYSNSPVATSRTELSTVLRETSDELEPDYEPSLTFTVVQKQFHSHLFCADKKEQRTDLAMYQPAQQHQTSNRIRLLFYSHQGIQDWWVKFALFVHRAQAYYNIFWDDNHFDSDEFQCICPLIMSHGLSMQSDICSEWKFRTEPDDWTEKKWRWMLFHWKLLETITISVRVAMKSIQLLDLFLVAAIKTNSYLSS